MYKQVLGIELPLIEGVLRAKKPAPLPAVFSPSEASRIISEIENAPRPVVTLLYRAGLRLAGAIRLRVRDVNFFAGLITVRDGKGFKDETTILTGAVVEPLRAQIASVATLHSADLSLNKAFTF